VNYLDRVWEAYQDSAIRTVELQRRLDLSDDEASILIATLADMAANGNIRAGYRCKRISKQSYKLIKATASASTQREGDSPKGLPLPPPKESLVGANTAVFDDQPPENEQIPTNDPFPAVPAELKARPQWVNWVLTERDGKPTKVPIKPPDRKGDRIIARGASTNKPATWRTYQQVLSVHERYSNATIYTWKNQGTPDNPDWVTVAGQYSGIGFVFSKDDPYCGIDLDDCLDAHGNLKEWATPIVDRLKAVAYGEKSPSGNGIKFWTRATLPPVTNHKTYIVEGADAIEVYDQGRYFTVTGKGKGTIGEGQADIDWLIEAYFTPQPTEPTPPLPRSAPTSPLNAGERQQPSTESLNAGEVINRISTSKQCHKFDALMAGNTTGYGSQSEADLGLCGVIAFYSQDSAVIDSIFRTSRLMRAKWDEKHTSDGKTYGEMTIAEALSGERETYTPPRRKPLSKSKRRLNRSKQLYGRKR